MSTKKAPVSSAQLIEQKQEAEAQLDTLRQQQVDALEEGRDFPHSSEFVTLNERMAALDKAIARAEAREDQERQRQALIDVRERAETLASQIKEAETKRLDTLAAMQATFNKTLDLRRQLIAQGDQIYALLCEIVPFIAAQPAAIRRLGNYPYPKTVGSSLHTSGPYLDRLDKYLDAAIVIERRGDLPRENWREMEDNTASRGIWLGTLPELQHIVDAIPEDGIIEGAGDAE
ncbi:hypothetical protein [Rhizobium sp. SYY.PMSO]|uniref:hypothetical protein n=1 Tax=Rhizobium sp. SYY.PMSO TaxID=3382192 RepID=UPI00398FB872